MTKIVERLATEADLCRNEGATDIADLLDDGRKLIEALTEVLDGLLDAIEAVEREGGQIIDPHAELAARAALNLTRDGTGE